MENATKLRVLYLYKYLVQNSDVDHPKSTVMLAKMLEDEYGITTARNTISNDLSMLVNGGLHIEVRRSTQNLFYYDGAPFETAELKVLIDAVSATKFITARKSRELINKITSLTSAENGKMLRRNIEVEGRVKSANQCGYYIVDTINEAIDTHHKISFRYTDYDINKKRCVTNGGQRYTVSPYTLIWDGDFYYLRGFCDERGAMRTFRLDRIDRVPEILPERAAARPKDYSVAEYRKSVFRMFDTDQPEEVELICQASVMKAVIDNFGIGVDTEPVDEEHFRARVTVCASPTFYSWVFGFGDQIVIAGPESVREEYAARLRTVLESHTK